MAAALAILTEALDEPGTDIAHSLHWLTLDAAAAVTSYLGLSVVVSHSDPPFTASPVARGPSPATSTPPSTGVCAPMILANSAVAITTRITGIVDLAATCASHCTLTSDHHPQQPT